MALLLVFLAAVSQDGPSEDQVRDRLPALVQGDEKAVAELQAIPGALEILLRLYDEAETVAEQERLARALQTYGRVGILPKLFSGDDAARRCARRDLARIPGSKEIVRRRLEKTKDSRVRRELEEVLELCLLEERRREVLDRLAHTVARKYRLLVEQATSGDPGEVRRLVQELLPAVFGTPFRKEFRIVLCAALRESRDEPEWTGFRLNGLRILRRAPVDEDSIATAAGLLASTDARVRRDAIYTLATMQARERAADIAVRTKDPDPEVRREAVRALQLLDARDRIDEIRARLKDVLPAVRAQAAVALGRLGAHTAVDEIVNLLEDPVSTVRKAAVRALAFLKAGNQADRIVKMLEDPTDDVRLEAMNAVAVLGAKAAIPQLRRELDSLNPRVRAQAVTVLAGLGGRPEVQAIASRLQDQDPRVRAAALEALAELGDRGSLEKIAGRLEDPDAWVRRSAVDSMAALGAKEYEESLMRILREDRAPLVAVSAARAVSELGLRRAVPVLVSLTYSATLGDRFGEATDETMVDLVRAAAVDGLGRLDARDQADRMEKLVRDPSPTVRRAAARALVRLTGLERTVALKALLADSDRSVVLETVLAVDAEVAPRWFEKVRAFNVPGTEGTVLASNVLPRAAGRLGLDYTVEDDVHVRSMLGTPVAVPEAVSLEEFIRGFVRDTHFQVAVWLDPHGGTLQVMRWEKALQEVRDELGD